MKTVRVRVENGRITGQAPPGFPEGDVEVRLVEPEDEMSDEELQRLDEALARGFESIKAGRFRPASDVIAALRHR
jgi:hypothetical protein